MNNERRIEFTNQIRVTRQLRKCKNNKCSVFHRVFLTINGSTKDFIVKSTDVSNIHKWDKAKQEFKGKTEEVRRVNSKFNKEQADITRVFNQLDASSKTLTFNQVKNKIKHYVFGKGLNSNDNISYNLSDLFDRYIELNKHDLGENRTSRYILVKSRSERFNIKKFGKKDIELTTLSAEWYSLFSNYLIDTYKISLSTLGGYLKVLKAVINRAIKDKILITNPFQECKHVYTPQKKEYLTKAEIDKIQSYNYNEELTQMVADCFVFACNTGLSHSDLERLRVDNLRTTAKGNYINGYRIKTGEEYTIPLNKTAIKIIDKYAEYRRRNATNKLLPVSNLNTYNNRLKRVAAHCDITTNLRSHLARHTFAVTVWLSANGTMEVLAEILGHKSIKTTESYYGKITIDRVLTEGDTVFSYENNLLNNENNEQK